MQKRSAHLVRRRPGFFHPAPTRARRDGWSVERQCGFLAALYVTGSVTAAARAVGMTRESAYRLRARPGADSFAAAWERVLAPPGTGRCDAAKADYRKVTNDALGKRVELGLVKPVVYRGRTVSIRRKADNSALFRLLRRLDARCARGGLDGRDQ